MCLRLKKQILGKTKFFSDRLNFMEKCENEIEKILHEFAEQIDQLADITPFNDLRNESDQTKLEILKFGNRLEPVVIHNANDLENCIDEEYARPILQMSRELNQPMESLTIKEILSQ